MNRSRFGVQFVLALASGCLVASPAAAQRATGPFAGLFGGQGGGGETLDFRGSVIGSYDHDVLPGARTSETIDPVYEQSGLLDGATAALAYRRGAQGPSLFVNGTQSIFHYGNSPGIFGNLATNAGLSTNLTRKVTFLTVGDLSYSRFYQFTPFVNNGLAADTGLSPGVSSPYTNFAPFPGVLGADTGLWSGVPLTPNTDLAAASGPMVSFDGRAGLTDKFSRRSSVSGDLTWGEGRLLNSRTSDVLSRGGHAGFYHQLSRRLGFHLGYGRQEVRYGAAGSSNFASDSYDVGVDYGDALSIDRKTSFSFNTSTSAVHFSGQTRYQIGGGATLTRAFSRTWSSSLVYTRGTAFLAGLTQPYFSDSVDATVTGLLAPRVQWYSGAGASRGSGVVTDSDHLTAYRVMSGLQSGITRKVGVFVQYSYYRYGVPAASTSLQLPSQFTRQTATVGVSLWVPIINQARLTS